MASRSGGRRMVFDTRGRRKHVVRVVYAVLALMMGASLFLVVGPVNIGALIGNQGSSSSAAKVFDERSERIEGRLAKDPTDEALLLALVRARLGAGNAGIEVNTSSEAQPIPIESRNDFEAALVAWNRYLKRAGDEPNATAAQLIALSFFKLAESSTGVGEAVASVATATAAQRITAEQRPNLNSLSTLAIYQFFNGEYAAGDRTTKQAAAKATTKAEAKGVEKTLAELRKNSKKFAKQKKEAAKIEKEAGKEKLSNPFGGLTGGSAGG